jgi:hypothetical protein
MKQDEIRFNIETPFWLFLGGTSIPKRTDLRRRVVVASRMDGAPTAEAMSLTLEAIPSGGMSPRSASAACETPFRDYPSKLIL